MLSDGARWGYTTHRPIPQRGVHYQLPCTRPVKTVDLQVTCPGDALYLRNAQRSTVRRKVLPVRFQSVCRDSGIEIVDDDIFCFMDDLTVALKPEYNPRIVAQILEEVLQGYGLKLNKRGKSAAISNQARVQEMPHMDSWYPVLTEDDEFELLGASLSANPTSFYENQYQRQSAFFDLLVGLHVHPALVYICVVTPASDTYVAPCHRSIFGKWCDTR